MEEYNIIGLLFIGMDYKYKIYNILYDSEKILTLIDIKYLKVRKTKL